MQVIGEDATVNLQPHNPVNTGNTTEHGQYFQILSNVSENISNSNKQLSSSHSLLNNNKFKSSVKSK
jgi:hypothetical protein